MDSLIIILGTTENTRKRIEEALVSSDNEFGKQIPIGLNDSEDLPLGVFHHSQQAQTLKEAIERARSRLRGRKLSNKVIGVEYRRADRQESEEGFIQGS